MNENKDEPSGRLAPRGSAGRLGRVLGIAVLAATLRLTPPPAAAQFIATWLDADGRVLLGHVDSGETSDLFDRADGLRPARTGNRYAGSRTLTLGFEGERPMEMSLYTALVQDGRIVREHRSEPFRVQPGRTITLRDQVILERELVPALDGSSKASAPEFIPAREFVPTEQVGRRGGERQVVAIVGGVANVDWSRQKALYTVVVPSIVGADVATRPVVILLDR